jgi:hypothetical protein
VEGNTSRQDGRQIKNLLERFLTALAGPEGLRQDDRQIKSH